MSKTHPQLKKIFLEKGQKLSFKKGETVYTSDDKELRIYYVVEGFVKTYAITGAGTEAIHIFYGEDDIFPIVNAVEVSLGIDNPLPREPLYYGALTDVKVMSISKAQFAAHMTDDRYARQELLTKLLQNQLFYLSQGESLALRYASARVAHRVRALSYKFGNKLESGQVIIEIPLTHQDLADSLGMARETVSREFEKLKRTGLIDSKDHHIIVNDHDGLAAAIKEQSY